MIRAEEWFERRRLEAEKILYLQARDIPKELNGRSLVYFLWAQQLNLVKVGSTTKIKKRVADLRSMGPDRLLPLLVTPGDEEIERKIQNRLGACRSHAEWFHATARTFGEVHGLGALPGTIFFPENIAAFRGKLPVAA